MIDKDERKDMIKKFMEEHPESVHLAPTRGKTQKSTKKETETKTLTESPVEPAVFSSSVSKMSNITCHTIIMTFSQIRDYLVYAEELYDIDADATEKWQREINNPRIRQIGKYLTDHTVTYFPPLICVPVDVDLSEYTVTIRKNGLGVLDGQHRRGGIMTAIEQHPELANNTIPVCILDVADVDTRQQIFADVNRTPRKVSKSLNLVFDHNDREGHIAVTIAKTMLGLVDTDRLSPRRSSGHIMSLTNLYNLIRPMSQCQDDANGHFLSHDDIADVVAVIIDNLPGVRLVRAGQRTFGEMRQEYVCYYSTVWQALGIVLGDVLRTKTPDDVRRFKSGSQFVSFVKRLTDEFVRMSIFDITDKRWQHPDRLVVTGPDSDGSYKVGTQKDHVSAAKSIIMDFATTTLSN